MILSNLFQTIALWPRWLYKRTKVYLRKKPKIFVIGANKTGTTSLNDFFVAAGYIAALQRKFELLRDNYLEGNRSKYFNLFDAMRLFRIFDSLNKKSG